MRQFLNTIQFIINHPLNQNNRLKALLRYLRWQISCRLHPGSVAIDFVNNSRLLLKPGMTGATGNIYTGLHEFEDMAFVLHVLRKNDLFIDVGANVGTYTVLAGAAVGADCLSIEPVPDTFKHLMDNIYLNDIKKNVKSLNIGLGREDAVLKFTASLDCTNHVVTGHESKIDTISVNVKKLDSIIETRSPTVIKIDVEGFETEVIAGAANILSSPSILAVIMELNGSGKRYGYDEAALHQKMVYSGFAPFSYEPFKRELIPLHGKNAISENFLYVNNFVEVSKRLASAPRFLVHATNKEI